MTPQMGGNIAFQRRHPVRAQPDETVCEERYGICIRKTQYREDQQDRVSTSFNYTVTDSVQTKVVQSDVTFLSMIPLKLVPSDKVVLYNDRFT